MCVKEKYILSRQFIVVTVGVAGLKACISGFKKSVSMERNPDNSYLRKNAFQLSPAYAGV